MHISGELQAWEMREHLITEMNYTIAIYITVFLGFAMHLLQGHYYSSHEGSSLISLDCDFPTAPSLCGGRIHHTECDRFQDQSPALEPASFSCSCCCCCYLNVPGSRALGQPL